MTHDPKRRRPTRRELDPQATNPEGQMVPLATQDLELVDDGLHDTVEEPPPARARQRWVEDARTMVWEGAGQQPPEPQPARDGLVRYGAPAPEPRGYAQLPPQARAPSPGLPASHLLETPPRLTVQSVSQLTPSAALPVVARTDSAAAEQYRVLSVKLREERDYRVVSLAVPTAATPGHVPAANLALALAESSRTRVCLLDTNLRGTQMDELFAVKVHPGLGEQIRHHRRNPEDNWLVSALYDNLHFISAGGVERNPASLLHSEVMADLLDELRRTYDFIVVATPPVMESADATIVQDHMDGVILVVRAGVTTRRSIAATLSRLGETKFIGSVLLDAQPPGD